MRTALLLWLAFALGGSLTTLGYEEKEPPPGKTVEKQQVSLPGEKEDGCVSVPIWPIPGAKYPYYGGTPPEMIPYSQVEPFYRYWLTRLQFLGPGRDYPDPPNLKSLKVGLLSPASYGPEGVRGLRTRQGIELAFAEENASRKPGTLPFEIIYRQDSPQWGSAANIAVEFADNDVLGFLGTVDGDATHVALRVALKIETYMINTSDPDPTLTETQIPWLTRVFTDDRQQCMNLADIVVRERGFKRIAVFRESSRPGRVGVMHFINDIRRLGHPPVQHIFYRAGGGDLDPQIQALKAAEPDAILFYGQPADIGTAAAAFRRAGITAAYFGFDRLFDPAFAKAAGAAAEGTTITYFFDPKKKDQPWLDFAARYHQRYGEPPDIYAGYGYDGARLMIDAINKAGPNRVRVHDYLAGLEEYQGVTGHMLFDARWDNIAPIVAAEFRTGEWHFRPAPDLNKNRQAMLTPP